MTLQLEENELRELRLAISSRIVIIDGLDPARGQKGPRAAQ
jgi:hypothetical protein